MLTKVLLLNPDCDVVQYADDGILYNLKRSPAELLTFPVESGIKVNWQKSGGIRREGVWETGIKFIGLLYTPDNGTTKPHKVTGKMSNSTRTPRPFTFDSYSLIDAAVAHDKKVSPTGTHKKSFIEGFKTKYYGFIMSRLYQGNLNIDDIQQDFTYHFKRWSWADLDRQLTNQTPYYPVQDSQEIVKLNVFNSSYFAHKSLANRINKTLARRAITGFRC